jgi:hypothetical protein
MHEMFKCISDNMHNITKLFYNDKNYITKEITKRY